MSGRAVTATLHGERVHLDANIIGRTILLRGSFDPVTHGEATARRIAALAEQDEDMSDVRIEQP